MKTNHLLSMHRVVRTKVFAYAATALFLGIICLCFFGCPLSQRTLPDGASPNDIFTFKSNKQNKPIIRIAMQYYFPKNMLEPALEEAFPDYLFVFDYATTAGVNSENRLLHSFQNGFNYDIFISGGLKNIQDQEMCYLYDLSAESFIERYLLSSLNTTSSNGHLYYIPSASTISGIAYNTQLFQENGWNIPETFDEFFALCEKIKQTGIRPFSACLKYMTATNRLFTMMCYDQVFRSTEDVVWLQNVAQNKAPLTEHIMPLFELAKRFRDAQILTIDDFSASLTKQRKAFFEGKTAMIDYDTNIYSYAIAENAPFEIGMMPYPTKERENTCFSITPEYYLAIPNAIAADKKRLERALSILDFLSTPKGQEAMFAESVRITNIKGMNLPQDKVPSKYIQETYRRGNMYPETVVDIGNSAYPIQDSMRKLFSGASTAEAASYMDEEAQKIFSTPQKTAVYETLTTAESNFTMLETSYYIADKLREYTKSDIALVINRGFYRSNLASISKGAVTSNVNQFIMKGMSPTDYLTEYRLSGAQLLTLLEHPIVNDTEIDALLAASGLKITYAPWNERGSRVLSLTLADGSELKKDTLYTVSAYKGSIDERYISDTVRTFEEAGAVQDLLYHAFKKETSIKPDIEERVTLVW